MDRLTSTNDYKIAFAESCQNLGKDIIYLQSNLRHYKAYKNEVEVFCCSLSTEDPLLAELSEKFSEEKESIAEAFEKIKATYALLYDAFQSLEETPSVAKAVSKKKGVALLESDTISFSYQEIAKKEFSSLRALYNTLLRE